MKVVTAREIRQIDEQTIKEIGIPGIVLMENAGSAVVQAIRRHFPECQHIGIFVGKGNNGGDGLVVARQLALAGESVELFLVSPPDRFTGDALTNLKIAQNLNLPLVAGDDLTDVQIVENPNLPIMAILSEANIEGLYSQIASCDLIVDAIFGTGLRGGVDGYIAEVIECINSTGRPVVAVDLPSGLEADTGMAEGVCVQATYTVTMGLPKRGLLVQPGATLAGQIEVAQIGLPPSVIRAQSIQVNWTQLADAAQWIPPRHTNSHKGTYGRVFIVAASTGMTGAAALAGEAVLRVGAGLVTLGIPKSLNPILEAKVSEVMTLPLPETAEGSLNLDAKSQILEYVNRTGSVLAIGPGLSQQPETVALVHSLIRDSDQPMLIDADGLNALSKSEDLLSSLPAHTVLTPHPGEMTRLVGGTVVELENNRIRIGQQFAQEHGVTLVLKGVPTVIAGANGGTWLNSTGNPGMSTAGMGDVLTGIIAGLMAQELSSYKAAVLGVYLHGLAGDIAAESTGMHGLMARDVLAAVPEAMETCTVKRDK